jgi:hypothetical protein
VRALNELEAARSAEMSAATNAHGAALRAANDEVTHAQHTVRQAEETVRTARVRLDAVDERARGLWSALGALLGPRGRRLGPLPSRAPDPSPDLPAPADLLDRATDTIVRAARGEPIAAIPNVIIPALPPAGALAALAVGLPLRGILALVRDRIEVIELCIDVLIFFAPFAGVPLLLAWARHRYGARPDIGAIALVALGGMIASCALVLMLR